MIFLRCTTGDAFVALFATRRAGSRFELRSVIADFANGRPAGAFMVEPIFHSDDVNTTRGTPTLYTHISEGSGKCLYIHSCANCATKLYVTFERFPNTCGIYSGTFDDPAWFPIGASTRHIFIGGARPYTILPAGIALFHEHAVANDGTEQHPLFLDSPREGPV